MKATLQERLDELPESDSLSAQDTYIFETSEVISIGLGWFFSVKGFLAVLVCICILIEGINELKYSLQKSPKPIATIEEISSIEESDYLAVALPLDYEMGIQSDTIGGSSYTLTPVANAGKKLIVYEEGKYVESNTDIGSRVFKGQAVFRDYSDEWNADHHRIDLINQFARANITVPPDAILLVNGLEPKIHIWTIVLILVAVLILNSATSRLARTILFLRNRSSLARHLNKILARQNEKPN